MKLQPGQEIEIVSIFSGDGQMYDQMRGSEDPVRIGSMLCWIIEPENIAQTPPEMIKNTDET